MIKAILFDIDGVLLDSRETNYNFCKKVFKKYGYDFVSKSKYLESYFSLPMKDVIRKYIPGISENNVEKMFLTGKSIPYIHKKSDLPKNEIPMLSILKEKFLLGIVTGRTLRGVREYFRVSTLENYFSVVSCFEDYSKPKPDPEPMMIALTKLQLKPEEAIYVGDSVTDLQAAKAINMKFIGFYGISGKIFQEADANVRTFAELPGAIVKLVKD